MGRSVVRAGAARCPECSLPPRWCICATLPPVQTGLSIHLLIHRHEHRKPSSTGRLIARAIPESITHIYQRARGSSPVTGLVPNKLAHAGACWILHPGGEPLPDVASSSQRPGSILLLDGTWKQAHEMLRTVESVGRSIRLPPHAANEPSRYWLRDQPGPSQLSTAEALMVVLNTVGDTEASRVLRLHFEMHVYATLLSRGKREMAERYLGHSPLLSEAPDVLSRLHDRWNRGGYTAAMTTPSPASALLQPFELGGLALPNRIVMAPLTRGRAGKERIPNAVMATYYAQRASAGLIISEATTISEQANGWRESPGIYTDAMEAGWKVVTSAVHAAGGRIFLQLWHMGRASHSDFHDGSLPVSASAVRIEGDHIHTPLGKKPYETPRALESWEIPGIVADYRRAAARAREAGFDGVEIHAANGYLIDQFLQSKTNHRTDDYGGSIEKRARFLKEIVEAVTVEWPAGHVGVRIAPNGVFNGMGSPNYREQFTFVATMLDRYSLAYLHVMDGLAFGFHNLGEPITLAEFRRVFHGPLMGNCGYTFESAEAAVAGGAADLIAFGRPFISNPDLVERLRHRWPLAEPADMATWYSPTGGEGYTDFPSYVPA